MGALTTLDVSSNNVGELVLPEGWASGIEEFEGKYQYVFTHTDGTKQTTDPSKPLGAIAIANAIPTMGALTNLNISNNQLTGEYGWETDGVKALAGAIKVNVSALQFD